MRGPKGMKGGPKAKNPGRTLKRIIGMVVKGYPCLLYTSVMRFLEGDVAGSREIQLKALPLIDALFCEVNPIPVKTALNLMGKEVGPLRAPLCTMEAANEEKLRKALVNSGIAVK